MLRHHHNLDVLLGDLECRYGKDHPMSQDIREAIPKIFERSSSALKTISSMQKRDTRSRFKHDETRSM